MVSFQFIGVEVELPLVHSRVTDLPLRQTPVVSPPDAIDLRATDNGQKADEVGPDFINDGDGEHGDDADADELVGAFIFHVSFRERPGAHYAPGRWLVEGNGLRSPIN